MSLVGYIYRLDYDDKLPYLGSTMTCLDERLRQHRCGKQDTAFCKFHKNINWDNVTITMIEKIYVNNIHELRLIEQSYYEKGNWCNFNNPVRQINDYKSNKGSITCTECGGHYRYGDKKRHLKSKLHSTLNKYT